MKRKSSKRRLIVPKVGVGAHMGLNLAIFICTIIIHFKTRKAVWPSATPCMHAASSLMWDGLLVSRAMGF